jgi:hypothetical protein
MMVMSSGGITLARPSRSFEAPIPPANAVTFIAGSKVRVQSKSSEFRVQGSDLEFGIRFLILDCGISPMHRAQRAESQVEWLAPAKLA